MRLARQEAAHAALCATGRGLVPVQSCHLLADMPAQWRGGDDLRGDARPGAYRLVQALASISEPAVAHYHQAPTLADALGMRPLVAHCHLSLGKLYAMIGRHAEARAELDTAMTLSRAMDMTFWLPQAEAALIQVDT